MAEISLLASIKGFAALAACAHVGFDDTERPDYISDAAWNEAERLIVDLDGHVERAERADARDYLERELARFESDPADSDFQRGYYEALKHALEALSGESERG